MCLARKRDVGHGPVFPEGDAVEAAQGTDALVETTPGDLRVVHQIPLIRTNVFRPEPFRGPSEVPGREGPTLDLEALGFRGEMAYLHVFDVTLTSGCHDRLLSRKHHVVREHPDPPGGSLGGGRGGGGVGIQTSQPAEQGLPSEGNRFSQRRSKARETKAGGTDRQGVAITWISLFSTAQRFSPTIAYKRPPTALYL